LIHYPIPAHLQKAYAHLGGKPGQLRATERVAGRILSLPMHQGLTDDEVSTVIAAVKSFTVTNGAAVLNAAAPQVSRI
jgi:dTDP-4-amino-4,6-dideoxygalactose transaminase